MSSRNNRGLSSRDGGGCNSWTGGRVSGSCHSWGKSKVDIGSEACWSDGPSSSVGHWQGVVVVGTGAERDGSQRGVKKRSRR